MASSIFKLTWFRRLLESVLRFFPDRWVICLQHRLLVGRWPNLKTPERFTDKIQWYKLNYRDPLMTQCVDKYREKFYLAQKGFEEFVPMTLQICDRVEEINYAVLPDSFIIKCNNGYGNNYIVRDKSKINIAEIVKVFNAWHSTSPVSFGREWAFINVPPQILVEELLVSKDGTQKCDLNDYKVMCFNGEPRVVWVDIDRYSDHKRNFYDTKWNPLPIESDCPRSENEVSKPYGFEKMLQISTALAKDFPFVRVDFYSVNNRVYIGEMTFYPWSGCVNYKPDSFDFELGDMFQLPLPLK